MMQTLYDLSCRPPRGMLGRELRRIANKVRDRLTRYHDPVVRTKVDGFDILVHASNWNPVHFSDGFYSDFPVRRLLRHLGEVRGVVDIGANVGYTALMAHAVAPNAEYLLIEGDPRSFKLLEQNTKPIERRWLQNVVLCDVDGTLQGEFMQQAGTASFVAPGTRAVDFRGDNFSAQSASHRTAKLDSLTSGMTVDFVKLDTDGHETKILAGARHTLTKHRPAVFSEFNPSAMVCKGYEPEPMRLFALLREYGYDRFAFYDQQGRMLFCTGEEATIEGICRYCMAAAVVLDVVTMQADFDAFLDTERQHAEKAVQRYMDQYGWRHVGG